MFQVIADTTFAGNETTSFYTTIPPEINTTYKLDVNATSTVPENGSAATLLIYVSYFVVPTFFILGLFGNFLTILVTRNRLYKYSSHGIFLRTMALNDIIFLLAFPFNKQFVHDLVGIDVRSISVIGCKLYFVLYRTSRISSALFMVQICVERFFVVWYPLKSKLFSTKRAAIILVCCTFLFVASFCGAWTIAADIGNGRCLPVVVTKSNQQILSGFSYVGMSLRTFIPASMLLCFTPLTLIKLYSQRAVRRTMSKFRGTDETYRTTVMLLSVIIAFMVLTMPFCITKHILLFNGIDIVTSPLPWARSLYEVSQICEQTDCVLNFVIYVSVSASFRHYLSLMIKSRRTREPPTILVSTVSTRGL